jgi:hypothetical protein
VRGVWLSRDPDFFHDDDDLPRKTNRTAESPPVTPKQKQRKDAYKDFLHVADGGGVDGGGGEAVDFDAIFEGKGGSGKENRSADRALTGGLHVHLILA